MYWLLYLMFASTQNIQGADIIPVVASSLTQLDGLILSVVYALQNDICALSNDNGRRPYTPRKLSSFYYFNSLEVN